MLRRADATERDLAAKGWSRGSWSRRISDAVDRDVDDVQLGQWNNFGLMRRGQKGSEERRREGERVGGLSEMVGCEDFQRLECPRVNDCFVR